MFFCCLYYMFVFVPSKGLQNTIEYFLLLPLYTYIYIYIYIYTYMNCKQIRPLRQYNKQQY